MVAAMYKALFQNSKVALLFAIITIMSAVSMVGTSEDSGLVLRVASLVGGQRSNAAPVSETAPVAGEQRPAQVFGEYQPQAAPSPQAQRSAPTGGQAFSPMNAPLSPTAIVQESGPVTAGGPIPESEWVQPE
jgi:hypothetical protein